MKTNTIISSAVLCCLLAGTLSAGTIIVPVGYDGAEGAFSTNTPVRSAARTLQMAFDPTELDSVAPGSYFRGMRFRLNGGLDAWPAAELAWNNYDVIFSESNEYPVDMSITFAENIGPDAVTVRSGPLTIPADSFPGGAIPNDFGFLLQFTSWYRYQGGILLITIRHDGNGVEHASLDATDDGFGVVHRSLAADSFDAEVANLTLGSTPILALEYQAIPEPATLLLSAAGLLAIFYRRRLLR